MIFSSFLITPPPVAIIKLFLSESSLITSTEASPIKSLTAKKDIVSIKIDESALLSNYYELKGFKSFGKIRKIFKRIRCSFRCLF